MARPKLNLVSVGHAAIGQVETHVVVPPFDATQRNRYMLRITGLGFSPVVTPAGVSELLVRVVVRGAIPDLHLNTVHVLTVGDIQALGAVVEGDLTVLESPFLVRSTRAISEHDSSAIGIVSSETFASITSS